MIAFNLCRNIGSIGSAGSAGSVGSVGCRDCGDMQYDDHATHQGGGDSLLCPAHCVCVTVSHSHVISDHQEGRPSTVWGVDTTATNPVYRLGLLSVSVSSCRGEGAAVLPAMPSTDTNTVTTLACRHCRHCRLSSCRETIIPVSPLA